MASELWGELPLGLLLDSHGYVWYAYQLIAREWHESRNLGVSASIAARRARRIFMARLETTAAGVIYCVFVSLLCLPAGLGSSAQADPVPTTRIGAPPVLDGKLDDACWRKAKPVGNFLRLNERNPAKLQTTAFVLYDDANLYIGARLEEPNPADILKRRWEGKDPHVFNDDCLEVMIDPGLSRELYYHYAVSAGAFKFDEVCRQGGHLKDPTWNGQWEAKTSIGNGFWSVEIAIPFYSLGVGSRTGTDWGINIVRSKQRPAREHSHLLENSGFHMAGSFRVLKGIDVNFNEYAYRIDTPAVSTEVKGGKLFAMVAVPIKNETGKEQKVQVVCRVVDPAGNPMMKSAAQRLASAAQATVNLGPFVLDTEGEHDLSVLARDVVTKTCLSRLDTKIEISYVPLGISVIEPFYRDCIFSTQELKNVVLDVQTSLPDEELANKKLHVSIREKDKATAIVEKVVSPATRLARVEFPVEALPFGRLLITAALTDEKGGKVVETAHDLRKLPHKKGEVWLGKDMVWYIDGEPFWYQASWGNNKEDVTDHYTAYFGRDGKPYWPTIQPPFKNWKFVDFMCDRTHNPELRSAKEMNDNIRLIVDGIIERYPKQHKDIPNIFGYLLMDEPQVMSSDVLEYLYNRMRDEDPYHPVILTCDNPQTALAYMGACDYMSLHYYATYRTNVEVNDISGAFYGVDNIREKAAADRKFIGFLIQGNNFGDFGHLNERINNYTERRGQILMAVVAGAKGCTHWNRMFRHYPENYIGVPHLARELDYLSKAIMAPTSALTAQADNDNIRTLLKETDGELYLFAVNLGGQAVDVRIIIPGLSKIKKVTGLSVISEDRTVTLREDSFGDRFAPYFCHVYTTSAEDTDLTSIAKIQKEIADVYAARRKPGNLAYQRYDGDGVTFKTSSWSSQQSRTLTHVVDGVTDGYNDYGAMCWQDTTRNKYPDWLEVILPEQKSIGRVVIYTPPAYDPDTNTTDTKPALKDFKIQAFKNGKWVTVGSVSRNDAEVVSCRFTTVKTARVRVWVTATNGPFSKVSEIEMYEK